MDAVEMIQQDHDRVKDLFEQFRNAEGAQAQRRIVEKCVRELMVHERIEEGVLYPAFREAAKKEGQQLVDEAEEEHHVVDLILDEIQDVDPRSDDFVAKFKVLMELVEHHIEEEENEMLPAAKELLGDRLGELGREMAELQESLMEEMRAE